MKWTVIMTAWLLAMPAWAADLQAELADIQQRWAEIQYQLPEQDQEKAFEALATEAEAFVGRHPDKAEP